MSKIRLIYSILSLILFGNFTLFAQVEKEIPPPFHIKTVAFVQNDQNKVPIFQLGEGFQLEFDDLYGNEANHHYEIYLQF